MQCLTFVPYCMKCQKRSVLVFAMAGWRAYTDHLHGLSGCCFEMQKNSKTQHKELPHICNIGLFYTCMHTRYGLHCWQLNNRQLTSVGFYICTHTHLQKNTVRGIKQLAEEKTPNATKHNPADLRKSGQDHGPMSGS